MTDLDATEPMLEIPGVYQGLASGLIFQVLEMSKGETNFRCTLYKGAFQGSVALDTLGGSPPSALFAEMAREWRGWSGTKTWEDIEKILALKASSDSTGHITLHVEMRPQWPPYGVETVLASSLVLEAGSLDRIARDVAELFQDGA